MSDKDRSRADDGGRGGGGGGADDDDGEGPDPKQERCKGCERKGKKMPFFLLRKSKKLRHQKRKQKGICVNSGCRGGGAVGGGGGWCCLCLKQPRTLDPSGESPTSDPNSSEFTSDMLRALIEKNDFYSKEWNPHLDADGYEKENIKKQNDRN